MSCDAIEKTLENHCLVDSVDSVDVSMHILSDETAEFLVARMMEGSLRSAKENISVSLLDSRNHCCQNKFRVLVARSEGCLLLV